MAEIKLKQYEAILRTLQGVEKFMPLAKQDRNALAEIFKDRIKIRTLKGVDSNDNPFTPYSQRYSSFRVKTGRGLTPNLFFKGHMLAAMTHSSNKKAIRLTFRTAKEALKAHGHHNGNPKSNVPARAFFDLNDSDIEAGINYLERIYGKKLESR